MAPSSAAVPIRMRASLPSVVRGRYAAEAARAMIGDDAMRQTSAAGTTHPRSSSAAAIAHAAPNANAANGETVDQIQPKISDAGSSRMPDTRLYQPNAVPLRSCGTRSATFSFSVPSNAAVTAPYPANAAQSAQSALGKRPIAMYATP